MSKFYQRVATPETQYQQSVTPSGPSVDANARAEAQNDIRNNVGQAIMDLVGTASDVASTAVQMSRAEKVKMQSEHQLDIDQDLEGFGSFVTAQIDAKDESNSIPDYDAVALRPLLEEATDKFAKSRKLGERKYYNVLKDQMEEKKRLLFNTQAEKNRAYRQEKRYSALMSSVKSTFDVSNDPATIVSQLQDKLEQNVGVGTKMIEVDGKQVEVNPAIQDTEDNAKLRMVQPILESVMASRDPKALKLLESKEMKEFFDFPDYDNVISAAKQQVQSSINRNRQMSYDRLEEAAYYSMDAGMFKSVEDVEEFFDAQLESIDDDERPETKRLMALRENLTSSMQSELTFQNLYGKMKSGDYTVLQRSGLEKKQIDAMENKFFSVETGIDDLSPQGITEAIKSGQFDSQLKSYFSEGYPVPPHLEKWANTPPSGGIAGLRDKHETFLQLNSLTQDTSKTAMDIFNPKEYGRMMFAGTLIDNIDSGVLDEKEAYQVYSSFNNDLNKNVDSFGTFVSSKAAEAFNDEKVQDWLSSVKSDAPWTIDEYSSQAYTERQFKNYFSYAMEATDDVDQAKDMAEKMFYSRHTPYENPDGSEGVLPYEFRTFEVKDFVEVANELPEFQEIKEAAGYLGLLRDYDFESNLSFKPDPSYEKNKLMNFYYDGKFVLSINSDMMRNNITKLGKRKVTQAEERNINTTQNQ